MEKSVKFQIECELRCDYTKFEKQVLKISTYFHIVGKKYVLY